jgi:hypothetical protein
MAKSERIAIVWPGSSFFSPFLQLKNKKFIWSFAGFDLQQQKAGSGEEEVSQFVEC